MILTNLMRWATSQRWLRRVWSCPRAGWTFQWRRQVLDGSTVLAWIL